MANDEKMTCWPYQYQVHPYIDIRIRNFIGDEYPIEEEESVLVDTGYSGEILLPKRIYDDLKLMKWEEPELVEFELANTNKKPTNFIVSNGLVIIPKLSFLKLREFYPIKIHRFKEEDADTDEIIIGAKFIKNFKILLNGHIDPPQICILED